MSKKIMPPRALAFLLSEDDHGRSRNNAIIPSGTGVVKAGTVLGELTATKGHFVPSPNAEEVGVEGAEVGKALLGYPVDATSEDVEVMIVDTDAQVKIGHLTFHGSVDDAPKVAAKIAQLQAVGIRAR
jgi:hypothetical protein